MIKLLDLIVVGRELDLHYVLGKKNLGRVRIMAVLPSTLQTKSLDTGNTIWIPNPLAANVTVSILDDVSPVITIIEETISHSYFSKNQVIYKYEFHKLGGSDEIFPTGINIMLAAT